jgi:hypothetical protein
MSVDTELHIGIVDGDTTSVSWNIKNNRGRKTFKICDFAKELREDLWREHLGLTANDPLDEDPVVALKSNFPNGTQQKHHLRVFRNPNGRTDTLNMLKRLQDRGHPEFTKRITPRRPVFEDDGDDE